MLISAKRESVQTKVPIIWTFSNVQGPKGVSSEKDTTSCLSTAPGGFGLHPGDGAACFDGRAHTGFKIWYTVWGQSVCRGH